MFDYDLIIISAASTEIYYPFGLTEVTTLIDTEGNVRAYTYQAQNSMWMHWPGLATFRFNSDNNQILVIEEKHLAREFINDLFWRNVLPFVLQAQGWEAIHASAIKTPQGVVAFCAASGTGKSTIAYGLHQRGYPLWSDDSLIFNPSLDSIVAYPVQFHLRLLADTRLYFGVEHGQNNENHKQQIQHQRMTINEPGKLSTIFILERIPEHSSPQTPQVTRCSTTQSIQYLLKNAFSFSLYQKTEKKKLVSNYLELTARVPTYLLHLTQGLDDLDIKLDLIESTFKK